MPMLKVQTNLAVDAAAGKSFVAEASRTVAVATGKPETYVMVALEQAVPMMFAGDTAPLAYLELKSIGLSESQTAPASKALCELMHRTLNIPPSRVYIEFASASGRMWGYNGTTF
ncbi:MAG: hypothetical protein HQL37_04125 [Alphaproteobacteria bacterium]|nr:hypothetical protein [Alphaproteobacteria bacterium]